MTRTLMLSAILALAVTAAGQAQQDTTGLVPGRRIRVHQRDHKKIAGSFVSLDSASLAMVSTKGDTVRVPRADIAGVDLAEGTKSNAGKGAITGLLIGGGVGVVFALVVTTGAEDSWGELGAGAYAAAGGLVFGAIGAGVGALIGSGSRTDKWEPTAWPTVSFRPNGPEGGRVALGMHLRF